MVTKKFAKYIDNSIITDNLPGLFGKSPTNITLNKVYEIVDSKVDSVGNTMWTIINDKGKHANYHANRFEAPVLKKMMVTSNKIPLIYFRYIKYSQRKCDKALLSSEEGLYLGADDVCYCFNVITGVNETFILKDLPINHVDKGWKVFYSKDNRRIYLTALYTQAEVESISGNWVKLVNGREYTINNLNILWEIVSEGIVVGGGSSFLRKALTEELSEIGYKLVSSGVGKSICIQNGTYFTSDGMGVVNYNLPADYDKVIMAAKKLIKPKSYILNSIGSNELNIEIFSDKVSTKYGDIDISMLKSLVSYFEPKIFANASLNVGNVVHEAFLDISIEDRIIRIGCKTDNNLFSLKELKLIIECNNKLKVGN